ncbi:DnaJ domain-containing protein [Flammula alnicola]|nr:DnaJ domain-containing protein [Flammula alnicola]
MSQFPDYYKLLNVAKTATQDEIRQGYRKESLKTHPDRLVNAPQAEIKKATERFQAVADAYYVLSDPKRRQEYDRLYKSRADRTTDPGSSSSFFSQASGMFGGGGANHTGTGQPNAEGVFADVFDEVRPFVYPSANDHLLCSSYCDLRLSNVCLGGVGLVPLLVLDWIYHCELRGLMLGAFAGNRLGAVRDAKGKSVAAVFNDLGGQQKAEILRALAMKVLGSAL